MGLFTSQVFLGRERLKGTGPYIFVSNHESHFDPFIISNAVSPGSGIMPIRFFTRDVFFTQFIFRKILELLGAFPGRIGQGIDTAALHPIELLKRGYSVGIFPEWCFPTEPDISRMQLIMPLVSKKSGCSIVPMYLFGIENLTWWKLLRRRKKVVIVFGEPLSPVFDEPLDHYRDRVTAGMARAKRECIQYLGEHEKEFWKSYAEFYKYLELAEPYHKMKKLIASLLPVPNGEWLDLGTGSGAMVDILLKQPGFSAQVLATDFNEEMLTVARERYKDNPNVSVASLDLTSHLPYESERFSGIIANLVLPYIAYQGELVGRRALFAVISDLFRILKPGGVLLWSTPKYRVNFFMVGIGSWKSYLDREHPEYRSYAFHILRHALRIQEWGRREIYHFLKPQELEALMREAGFSNMSIKSSLVGQVYVITAEKSGGISLQSPLAKRSPIGAS